MSKLEMNLQIQDIDKVKTLIEILAKHQDSLPSEVVEQLELLADCNACEITPKNVGAETGTRFPKVFCDGVEVPNVTAVNRILKRVKHYGETIESDGAEGIREYALYPESCLFVGDDGTEFKAW